MSSDIKDPLTAPNCDLRDFAFMPLDVVRLRDSDLASTESPEACWAAVLLWAASWHQVPAASLPDDDRVLSNLAGYGRVVKEWMKVRSGAMRGWIKCSDGRLYHPVVAEKANESFMKKLKQRWTTECARIKKHNDRTGAGVPSPAFENWIDEGCLVGQRLVVPRDKTVCPAPVPCETHSKGQGEGQGELINTNSSSSPPISNPVLAHGDDGKPASPAEWIAVFAEQHGVDVDHRNFHDRKKFWPLASAWTNAGVTVGQMRAACAKAHEDAKESIAWLPAYADRVLASMQSEKKPAKSTQQAESFRERDDRKARERWEQMTGQTHPESLPKQASNVIDVTPFVSVGNPVILEISQ